ncbi:hypothetical protein Agub_g2199, partial [Astrephomene gubernaculifera]
GGQQQQQQGQQAQGVGGDAGWEAVVVGGEVPVDEEYMRRLAAGELQEWEVADPPTGCRTDGPLLPACGRYQISRRTAQLTQLLRELLDDACGGSRAVCRALRAALSSITLMARTLPPLAATAAATTSTASSSSSAGAGAGGAAASSPQRLVDVSAVPQLGLMAVNDLRHLADELLLLAAAYGPRLAAAAGEEEAEATAGMLADALQLRAAARAAMREQLRVQYGSLDEILAGLEGLRQLGFADAKVLMRQRRVVQQLLHSLGRLGRAACEVLRPEEAVGLAAAALEHTAEQLVAAVMAKSDMSRDECGEVAALLGPLAEGAVQAWLAAARAAGADMSGVPLHVVESAITARAHQLCKLRCVVRVLSSDSIGAISTAWDHGDLAAMTPSELEHLLLAISEDSPSRRALLQKLR